MVGLDWTNPDQMLSQYFTVGEALWLHDWGIIANPTQDVKDNLLSLCEKLDEIRDILKEPIIVRSMYRSVDYNRALGIQPEADVHSMGMACDFICHTLTPQEVQDILRPHLVSLNIRMEKGTPTWTHIDIHSVIYNREFSV